MVGLLPARPGRELDQGAQAAPRFRPDLLHEGDRQPVPAPDPHRRLLAPPPPAWPGSPDLVLAGAPTSPGPPPPPTAMNDPGFCNGALGVKSLTMVPVTGVSLLSVVGLDAA